VSIKHHNDSEELDNQHNLPCQLVQAPQNLFGLLSADGWGSAQDFRFVGLLAGQENVTLVQLLVWGPFLIHQYWNVQCLETLFFENLERWNAGGRDILKWDTVSLVISHQTSLTPREATLAAELSANCMSHVPDITQHWRPLKEPTLDY
jgi:hypothetical protein